MAKRQRNFQREYARRIARGKEQGLSRSAARGHPRAGERPRKPSDTAIDPNSREELALKMMRRGSTLREAASHYRISRERLRTYVKDSTEAIHKKGRWTIIDRRLRQFPFYSNGRVATPWMTFEESSRAGDYMGAVKRFLPSGDANELAPFAGQGVRDIAGSFHPFELDENTLYELDHRGEVVIPEQYRIG